MIVAQAGRGPRRENQMRCGMHRQGELGQPSGGFGSPAICLGRCGFPAGLEAALMSPVVKIPAHVMRFEHARVQRRKPVMTRASFFSAATRLLAIRLLGRPHRQVQHRLDHSRLDQSMKGTAKCVVVGHFGQADVRAPLRNIPQERHQPAIALFLMLPQHQTGEKLGIGKILAAELGAVPLKTGRCQRVRGIQHRPWRFTGFHPAWCSNSRVIAQISLMHIMLGSRQSKMHTDKNCTDSYLCASDFHLWPIAHLSVARFRVAGKFPASIILFHV